MALKFHNVVYFPSSDHDHETIFHDNRRSIPVQCVLTRDQLTKAQVDSLIAGDNTKELTGLGNFSLEIKQYRDQDFKVPIKSGEGAELEVEVGEELFFDVSLVTVDGFSLFLESCWMSPSAKTTAVMRHVLISDGYVRLN